MAVRNRGSLIIAAIALGAIAAWPFFVARSARASHAYVAPVLPDYIYRDKTISFYERRVREDPQDQISAKLLAGQYMQRYREALDVGDILRGIAQAKRSLKLQPQNNWGADEVVASGYYAIHDFDRAYAYEQAAHREEPDDSNAPAQMALLDMERGRYAQALTYIDVARRIKDDAGVWAAQARYDELTGNLAKARTLMARAAQSADEVSDNSAESRAWYHYRLGQMAFSSGHIDEALAQERLAVTQFPNFEMGYRALARFCWGIKNWNCALDAAKKGAAIIPEPETLGYEADAQAALGDKAAAAQTQALIFAVERIGNAYRINDRLLSVYYSEHGIRLDDSLQIARREALKRGPEVHAQDTLAWAAAIDGHWNEAYRAAQLAMRMHTQDPRMLFHAGMIELHFGHTAAARADLQEALNLNPHWDPFYADEAQSTLAKISPNYGAAL
jgi:tetratricopeptide (TPR) repeat protein